MMDYGPSLSATLEVGDDGSNIAFKGIAIRLDAGQGGVSRGRAWVVYDHDTLRLAAAWTGQGFIDWKGSISTAATRSIPGSSVRSTPPTPTAPAGQIQATKALPTCVSEGETAASTVRCPGDGPISRDSIATATR